MTGFSLHLVLVQNERADDDRSRLGPRGLGGISSRTRFQFANFKKNSWRDR
jgi:hypothetical protein